MKAIKTDDSIIGVSFVSEPNDSVKDTELKDNINKLMDSLKWFHQRSVKVAVKWKRTGYIFTFSK